MKYLAVLMVVVAVVAAMYMMPKQAHAPAGPAVSVGTTTFSVEVADTEATREKGLGGRDTLAQGAGMLFVFERAGNWGFWMKDTRVPLDIVWARADGTIVSVARGVATSTYPRVFYPATPDAMYVLEVNAGAAAGAQPGQKMTIEL
jgi:uncharacterized membrane protein (UPF0127 family)